MVYHQYLRLVVRLGSEHGYRIVTDDIDCKSSRIPRYLENIYFFCQDACVETENRRDQQEVSQAGRCNEETAGNDGNVQPVWCESDGWLFANVGTVPGSDCTVHVRAECYRIASAELLMG